MTRWCWPCGQEYPLSAFSGRTGVCKRCITRRTQTRLLFDPEMRARKQAETRKWHAANKDRVKAYHRVRKYKLTQQGFDDMFAAQGGVCAICGDPPKPGEVFVIDHDHGCCPSFRENTRPGCGRCVRGLLHSYCNKVEGMVSDVILEGLLRYRMTTSRARVA